MSDFNDIGHAVSEEDSVMLAYFMAHNIDIFKLFDVNDERRLPYSDRVTPL